MQSALHRVLQSLTLEVVIHLVRGQLAHIKNGFSRHVLRSDLVTHHAPPAVHRRRAADRPASEAAGRAAESSVPECPAAASESAGGVAGDARGSVARLAIGGWPVASAPPGAVKEWCGACSMSARNAVCKTAFNSIKAWQSTNGEAVRRRRSQAAGSNIQAGTSSDRSLRRSSKPHRQMA